MIDAARESKNADPLITGRRFLNFQYELKLGSRHTRNGLQNAARNLVRIAL